MSINQSVQRVLIVDDDPRHIRHMRKLLPTAGYEVLCVPEDQDVVSVVALEQPDLILMETLLQKEDSYKSCRQVREFSDVPIIFLSTIETEQDILKAFDSGADDYITKPFSTKILLARIRALLNRVNQILPVTDQSRIECGDLCIDLARREVSIAGKDVYLTATEYNLLYQLATHIGKVQSHEQLLTEVWGPEYRRDVDYLRSFIHLLRKKLERDPTHPEMILNLPGVGYILTDKDRE